MTGPPNDVTVIFGRTRALGVGVWIFVALGSLALMLVEQGAAPRAAWIAWLLLAITSALVFVPLGRRVGAMTAVGAAVVLGLLGLLPYLESPSSASGFAPWYIRFGTVVAVVLILRRRPLAGWIGVATMSAALLCWAITTGGEVGGWVAVVLRQLATVAAFQVFSLVLARTAAAIGAYRAEEQERIVSERRREVVVRERRAGLARIRALADPVLAALADGVDDPQLRRDALLAEAEIRDLLRGRRLSAPPLARAVRAVRESGGVAVLLDDLPDDDAAPTEAMLAWAAAQVAAAQGGSVTVRLSRGPSGPAMTVADGAGGYASLDG